MLWVDSQAPSALQSRAKTDSLAHLITSRCSPSGGCSTTETSELCPSVLFYHLVFWGAVGCPCLGASGCFRAERGERRPLPPGSAVLCLPLAGRGRLCRAQRRPPGSFSRLRPLRARPQRDGSAWRRLCPPRARPGRRGTAQPPPRCARPPAAPFPLRRPRCSSEVRPRGGAREPRRSPARPPPGNGGEGIA